ncbi:MAG: MFS transporter [bacterium]
MDARPDPHLKRNIKLYYLLTMSTNLWFGASSWLYVWRRFMTFGQLGWIDAIGFGFSLILDIPTGAFADIFGKKITLILSNICTGVGIFIIAWSNSLTGIFIGNMISQLGWAMYSGASDALVYDSLLNIKKEEYFSHVLARANQYMSYAAAFGYFVGGLLYTLYWRLPHIVWGLSYVPAIIISFLLIEPKVTQREHFSITSYLNKIHLGIKELLLPQLRKYILLIFILLGVYYLYTWGFVRPAIATSFGFYSREQSIILPILTLSTAFLVQYLPFVRKKIDGFLGLSILSILMAVGFFLCAFPMGYWGIVPMFLIVLAGKFGGPWVSTIVNKEISSQYRATTLSTISLLSKIPYVVVAVLIGQAAEKNLLPQFNLGLAGVIIFATAVSIIMFLISRQRKSSFI